MTKRNSKVNSDRFRRGRARGGGGCEPPEGRNAGRGAAPPPGGEAPPGCPECVRDAEALRGGVFFVVGERGIGKLGPLGELAAEARVREVEAAYERRHGHPAPQGPWPYGGADGEGWAV